MTLRLSLRCTDCGREWQRRVAGYEYAEDWLADEEIVCVCGCRSVEITVNGQGKG